MRSTSDNYNELINLIRSGDKNAFARLFEQYYNPLSNYAVTILKYPEIAEEVVQETFIKIWENRQSLNIDISLHAYLYRSVHNNCISYCRNQVIKQNHYKKICDEIVLHAEIANRYLSGNMLESIINGELEEFINQ